MKLEHRGTKILEKLISVPPRLLERLEYFLLTENYMYRSLAVASKRSQRTADLSSKQYCTVHCTAPGSTGKREWKMRQFTMTLCKCDIDHDPSLTSYLRWRRQVFSYLQCICDIYGKQPPILELTRTNTLHRSSFLYLFLIIARILQICQICWAQKVLIL